MHYTEIGKKYVESEAIDAVATSMKWKPLPCETGFMQGAAMKQANGVQGEYTNGTARVYLLDTGTELIPVASELLDEIPKEEE